jgi:hypothetical protein
MMHIEEMKREELEGATCLLCDNGFDSHPDAVKVKDVFFHPYCIVKLAIGLSEMRVQLIALYSDEGNDKEPN